MMNRTRIWAAAMCLAGPTLTFAATPPRSEVTFDLKANPPFSDCLVKNRWAGPPTARVTVARGGLNDILILEMHNIKPNLQFDMFTVQNSPFRADGTANPNFRNFGLAWYQSDLQADANGDGEVVIKTILLDQIFGFDAQTGLAPTNTFHVGFWFNDPHAAAACGFDPTKPTPFNGEHKAGPLAMISLPDAHTTLGPLCTDAENTPTGVKCKP